MIILNIPNFTKDEYIAYWVKLNKVIFSTGLIRLEEGYEPICKELNISLDRCMDFIEEAKKLGVINTIKSDNGNFKLSITRDYIIRSYEVDY